MSNPNWQDGGSSSRQAAQASSPADYGAASETPLATASKGAGGRLGGVIRWTYKLILATTNVPQPGPGYMVPPGCVVRIRGNSGTVAGNVGVVNVAEYREKLLQGLGTPVGPLDDIQMQVTNLAHLWFSGAAADGVVLSVQSLAQSDN